MKWSNYLKDKDYQNPWKKKCIAQITSYLLEKLNLLLKPFPQRKLDFSGEFHYTFKK